jgi:hypothetical protein
MPRRHVSGVSGRGDAVKKFFITLLFFMSSAYGCTGLVVQSHQAYSLHLDEGRKQILDWAAEERVNVDAGLLKNSDYWREFYRRTITLRPDWSNALFLADEMTKISMIFEEGKISQEQYENKYHQLYLLYEQDEAMRTNILSRPHTLHSYEVALFTCHIYSMFRVYEDGLRNQLKEADPKYTTTRCAVFEESIRCVSSPAGETF